MMRIGAVEAGGTKFVCGIGDEQGRLLEKKSFPTGDPEPTVANVIQYFRDRPVDAVGIGCFGPIGLNPEDSDYGYVTSTPKPGWAGFNFLGTLQSALGVPCRWDTDVNAAALGEATWGAAQGLSSCIYFTVGTGIGAGVFAEGACVHGLVHPEGGHMYVRRHPEDRFGGGCPYHGDCLEGLAAGPALERRWGKKGEALPPEHPAWAMEAYYIGQAVANAVLLLSPHKVILGGGVMKQAQLFPMIRGEVAKSLNRYVPSKMIATHIDQYIVPPALGDEAGLRGALAIGLAAAK